MSTVRWTAFRIGAIAWIFTGIVHDILEFVLPGDPELTALMRTSDMEIGPVTLNSEQLIRGVSLGMGLAMITVGVLLWMMVDLLRERPNMARRFGIVALVASAALLAVAVLFVPGPPLMTFSVATIAFALALVPPRTRARTQTGVSA